MDRGSVYVKELCYLRSIGASNLIQIALKMAKIREGYFFACTVHVYRDPPVGHIAVKGLIKVIFPSIGLIWCESNTHIRKAKIESHARVRIINANR